MSSSGNKFTYLVVSPPHVRRRNDEIEKIELKKYLNRQDGIKKQINHPSYGDVCVAYKPPKTMLLPADTLVARTKFYAIPGALECGYSQSINWTAEGMLNAEIHRKISIYVLARLKLAGACIGISHSRSFKVKNFYQCIEASEKATISFIIGGFFCYQSATNWLNSRHEQIKLFIHAGLADKASLSLKRKKGKKTTPDYLIETTQGKWHVFESKGGESSSRWQRIEEGIAQLESVTRVGWKGQKNQPISTFVCTHTSIDSGKEIAVNVVDPLPGHSRSIILNRAVSVLLTKASLIDLFDVLAEDESNAVFSIPGMQGWKFINAPLYDHVQLGIPEKYSALKDVLRIGVGQYLALKEIIDDALMEDDEMPTPEAVEKRLSDLSIKPDDVRNAMTLIAPLLHKKRAYEDILHLFSEKLKLPELADKFCQEDERLEKALSESVRKHRSPWGGLVREAPAPGHDDPWEKKQRQNKMKP
ncbi:MULTISPECIES: hypothetical protein [Enterobacter]|uniref:hypothetical protein n=1 Tax=Enterobacter TaxID=547 RepID=UPI0005370606|nr:MULTISPECIES: hypothetical protein [Enterobacter]AMY66013.1 hypothetical protein NF29_16915 [Enterobacter cloacae]AVG33640.1 hypothetical protein MC67_01950 [Enterobacter cloacae complex sp.]EHN8903779.1 hypothetical protein [Enterobacter asburiae]EIR0465990.1 hypothetical protein [Enterobacter asburiae]EKZ3170892.1 hypothetical protein [Enterobacter asburiae]